MRNKLFFLFFVFIYILNVKVHGSIISYHTNDDENIEYRPFLEEGKQWTVISADHRIYWTKTYFIDGDTVVGSRTCKKLCCKTTDYVKNKSTIELLYPIFEEDGKVCYFPLNTDNSIDLYDFRANPGDTLSLGGQYNDNTNKICYQVWKNLLLEKDGERFQGQLATIYDSTLKGVDEDAQLELYEWYEGIGSVFHPFEKTSFNKYMGGRACWLYECRVGDRIIYSKRMGHDIVGISPIKETSLNHIFSFSLDGRKVLTSPSKGIYITNQRKIIYK